MNFDSFNLLKENIILDVLSLLKSQNYIFPEELGFSFTQTDASSKFILEKYILKAANVVLFEILFKAFSFGKFHQECIIKLGDNDPTVQFLIKSYYRSNEFQKTFKTMPNLQGLDLQGIQNFYHYQLKYQFRLIWDNSCNNFLLKPQKNARNRKEKGVFYTPDSLCKIMVERTLGKLLDEKHTQLARLIKHYCDKLSMNSDSSIWGDVVTIFDELASITICDPSMGTGAFLRASFSYLRARRQDFCQFLNVFGDLKGKLAMCSSVSMFFNSRSSQQRWEKHILSSMLYGVDLDDFSIKIAMKLLVLSCHNLYPELLLEETILDLNYKHGDALLSPTLSPNNPSCLDSFRFEIEQIREARLNIHQINRFESVTTDLTQIAMYTSQLYAKFAVKNPSEHQNLFDHHSFSWIFEFPEIFARNSSASTGDLAGFDIILNNPPWEMNQINDNEFFTFYDPNFTENAAKRKKWVKIEFLKNKLIHKHYVQYLSLIKSKNDYWKQAFRFQGENKLNFYKLFLERIMFLGKSSGYCSIIIPAGLLGEERANRLRVELVERKQILGITLCYSGKDVFPNIAAGMPLIILTLSNKSPTKFFNFSLADAEMRDSISIPLSVDLLQKISPIYGSTLKFPYKSLAIPLIFHQDEKTILSHLIQFPRVSKEWGFDTKRELNRTDDEKNGVIARKKTAIPVLEGKHLVQFGYSLNTVKFFVSSPDDYLQYKPIFQYERIVWRNVSNIKLRRRLFFALLPSGIATVNSLNYITPYRIQQIGKEKKKIPISRSEKIYLLGMLNSLVSEYWIRLFSTNNNVNQYLIQNLPIPFYEPTNVHINQLIDRVDQFQSQAQVWADQMVLLGRDYKKKRVLERGHWSDLAQIDALVFKIFGININQILRIFDRVPKVEMAYKNLVVEYFQKL